MCVCVCVCVCFLWKSYSSQLPVLALLWLIKQSLPSLWVKLPVLKHDVVNIILVWIKLLLFENLLPLVYFLMCDSHFPGILFAQESKRERECLVIYTHQPREEWQLIKLCCKQLFLLSFSSPDSQLRILPHAHHGLMWEMLNSDGSCLGLAKPRRVTNCLAGCNCPSPSLTAMKPGWSTDCFFCHSLWAEIANHRRGKFRIHSGGLAHRTDVCWAWRNKSLQNHIKYITYGLFPVSDMVAKVLNVLLRYSEWLLGVWEMFWVVSKELSGC